MNTKMIKMLKIISGCLLMGLTSACAQYLNHNEGVYLSAGNAVAHNKAIQMVDPWPRYARQTLIPGNGKRIIVGLNKYHENKTEEAATSNTKGED